jgi:hypothetical protein
MAFPCGWVAITCRRLLSDSGHGGSFLIRRCIECIADVLGRQETQLSRRGYDDGFSRCRIASLALGTFRHLPKPLSATSSPRIAAAVMAPKVLSKILRTWSLATPCSAATRSMRSVMFIRSIPW